MKFIHKLIVLSIFLFNFSFYTISQDYSITSIPESLKKNSNAVLRESNQHFSQKDINNAVYKEHKVITILNKNGNSYAHFHHTGDKFHELTDFSGIIRDASGKIVKKIKKSDLTVSTISEDAFATTAYTSYYECQYPNYPFTIEYSYQEKWKNGILSFPSFAPVKGYSISVEKAESKLEIPQNIQLRYHENYSSNIKKETNNNTATYSLIIENLEAIPYEPLAPSYRDLFPIVLMAPNQFCYDSYCGNMKDWKNYGNWIANLLTDRDELPPAFVIELQNITKNATNKREKVEILFDYLQKNTRYVSIQLGIGGYQPIEAKTVIKNRLGDCKGLTNLMKAMLKAVEIPSYYTIISTVHKSLYEDFPSFMQANHVILLVPQENDSIWLECTSQTLPFGYVHTDLAGHDAVIVTDEGGKLCKLPSYTDEQYLKKSYFEMDLSNEGNIKGNFSFMECLDGFESVYRDLKSNDPERVSNYINRNIKIPHFRTSNIRITEEDSHLPHVKLHSDFETADFVNKTGARFFIPVSPLKKSNFKIFTSTTRIHDIFIPNGFRELDKIVYNIPDGYTIESLPKGISLDTDFGTINIEIEHSEKTITYTQDILVKSGKYDKIRYNEIKDFFGQIESLSKKNIVLKKI